LSTIICGGTDENHELLKDDKMPEVRKAHLPNTSLAPTPYVSV